MADRATGRRNMRGASAGTSHTAVEGLQGLLDALPLGVFTIGRDKSLKTINREAARLLGVDAAEVLGRPCDKVFQCSFDGACCAAQEAHETGEGHVGGPIQVKAADGSALVIQIDAIPLPRGEVAVVMKDLTETERLRQTLRDQWIFHGMVGASRGLQSLIADVRRLAPLGEPALIVGERGTGKEVLARALHGESARASEPFVLVNCSAYSGDLLEVELFGGPGERGRHPGRFELARGGTLFIEELEHMPLALQARLASRMQELRTSGGNGAAQTCVIAATTEPPLLLRQEGQLDAALYERLGRHVLGIPPLRDRPEDVPVLVEHLLRRSALRSGKEVKRLTRGALDALIACSWPGNVRQLEEVIDRAVQRCEGEAIQPSDLPRPLPGAEETGLPLQEDRMREALRRAAGSISHAARLLSVHRTTLWRWMGAAGLKREDFIPK